MAGRKKQPELTAEEKLQQALVPEAEQPYKVPDNWCWVKAGNLFNLFRGVSYKKHEAHNTKEFNDCLIMRGGNILEGDINLEADNVYVDKSLVTDEQFLKQYDIVIVSSTGSSKIIGKAGIVDKDYSNVSFGAFLTLVRPIEKVDKKFVALYFQSELYRKRVRELANGVNINNVRTEHITGANFPLPPLAEQQRIVERIESLFAKLDEAKEKLQNTLDTFETRKAAILHKAFTGELTDNWRKQHGLTMDSWGEKTLQDVCSMKITDGTHKTPTYCDAEIGVPFLSAKDITSGKICWDNIKYITQELHEELYTRLQPQVDDILLAKNGTTGVAAIVDIEKIFDIYVTLAVLRPNQNIIYPRYLLNIVNSSVCKNQFDEHLTGIGVPNLHLRDIKQVTISVPTLDEQTEIVRIIDNMLAKEQQAYSIAQNALAKIGLIKKSILARAFRGQLATNNPADEPAIELLKRVL